VRWRTATLTSLTGFVSTGYDDAPDDWDLSSAGQLVPVSLARSCSVPPRIRRTSAPSPAMFFITCPEAPRKNRVCA